MKWVGVLTAYAESDPEYQAYLVARVSDIYVPTPVTLPPGRLRLATSLSLTGGRAVRSTQRSAIVPAAFT
jgi:hypothetical protein